MSSGSCNPSRALSWTGPRWNSCSASAVAVPSRSWPPVLPTASAPTVWPTGMPSLHHLRNLAEGDGGFYEQRRRRKVGEILSQLQMERLERPQLLVEAPVQILTQEFEDLSAGVRLEPGRITITFDRPQQALEKLLALAMAVGNDFDRFDRQVAIQPPTKI